MQIARDREEPGAEFGLWMQAVRVLHETHPGLFEQILGDLAPAAQADQKRVQPRAERVVHDVERVDVAGAQPADELQLDLPVHVDLYNARPARA